MIEGASSFNGKAGRGSFFPLWVILVVEGTDAPGHALWVLDMDGLLLEVLGRAMGPSAAGAGAEHKPFSKPGPPPTTLLPLPCGPLCQVGAASLRASRPALPSLSSFPVLSPLGLVLQSPGDMVALSCPESYAVGDRRIAFQK